MVQNSDNMSTVLLLYIRLVSIIHNEIVTGASKVKGRIRLIYPLACRGSLISLVHIPPREPTNNDFCDFVAI